MKKKVWLSGVLCLGLISFNSPAMSGCSWYALGCWTQQLIEKVEDKNQQYKDYMEGVGQYMRDVVLPALKEANEILSSIDPTLVGAVLNPSGVMSSTNPSFMPLTTYQKNELRPYFGNLVDEVRIHYGATMLNQIVEGGCQSSPLCQNGAVQGAVQASAQTFCDDIYISDIYYGETNLDQLVVLAHEMVHSKQCDHIAKNPYLEVIEHEGKIAPIPDPIVKHYITGYIVANQVYEDNIFEREAYAFEEKFRGSPRSWALAPILSLLLDD